MDPNDVPVTPFKKEHRCYQRLVELQEYFSKQFNSKPQFLVRVPGRVNIIGEHVDYCGYPVLPMALEQCILLAVGYSNGNPKLELKNINQKKFEDFECDLKDINIELPSKGCGPEWYKYFLCGVKGIQETLKSIEDNQTFHIKVALSGNVPPASGLSSSSALVSSATLAMSYIYGLKLDCKHLASIAACCERYIGTQGGGMDQAIAFLAKEGGAQFIEFLPELNATSVQLPIGANFVVANSLAAINKAATSDFNERVVECRLGCRLIAKKCDNLYWRNFIRLAHLQHALNISLKEFEILANGLLEKDLYTREDICAALEVSQNELENEFLTPNTQHMMFFKLRQRTLHVIQESLRVEEFRSICETTLTNGHSSIDIIKQLSQLMRQSHKSLTNLYECSHPNLDQLVSISDEIGIGARLTGAGWGGCIVALCKSPEESKSYIKLLKEKYFYKLPQHITEEHLHNDFSDVVFATSPCSGAEILTIE